MADYDFIVAGAGLAGACAAFRLREHGSVLVIEKNEPSAGGSGAAAGLVNPVLGLRARPVWRIDEAVDALEETIALSGAEDQFRRRPTLRPALDDEQVDRFRRAARELSGHCTWLADPGLEWLTAPRGALRIDTGGAVDIDGLVRRLLREVDVRSRTAVTGWEESDGKVVVRLGSGGGGGPGMRRGDGDTSAATGADGGSPEDLTARVLILALGRGYTAFPELMRLRLHQVKGQTIRVDRPVGIPADAPHLAGAGYVAWENGSAVCGSTYEHRFEHLRPSQRQTDTILQKISRMLPSIADAHVKDARAGVRVTVPGIRLPMVGPLPGRERVWIFTGLGAKGLLTGPLVARELFGFLGDPERIPRDIRVRLTKTGSS